MPSSDPVPDLKGADPIERYMELMASLTPEEREEVTKRAILRKKRFEEKD